MKFIVRKTGGDQIAAEEIFSATITAAWKGYQTFQHKSSYFTWICRIALNKTADYYRSQVNHRSQFVAPTLELLASIKDDNLLPEEQLALQELRGAIKECLLLLPKEKRQLLYMRYWHNLTLDKMASVMGISERAVEGQLYRARLALREEITQHYPEYSK